MYSNAKFPHNDSMANYKAMSVWALWPLPFFFLLELQVPLVTCSGNHKVKIQSPNFEFTPGAQRAHLYYLEPCTPNLQLPACTGISGEPH